MYKKNGNRKRALESEGPKYTQELNHVGYRVSACDMFISQHFIAIMQHRQKEVVTYEAVFYLLLLQRLLFSSPTLLSPCQAAPSSFRQQQLWIRCTNQELYVVAHGRGSDGYGICCDDCVDDQEVNSNHRGGGHITIYTAEI